MSISISPTLKVHMHPSGLHEFGLFIDNIWYACKNWTIFAHKHYVVQLAGLHLDAFLPVGHIGKVSLLKR